MAPTNEVCESNREKIIDHINTRIKSVKSDIPKNGRVTWSHFIMITLILTAAAITFSYVTVQRVTKIETIQEHTQKTLDKIEANQKEILERLPHRK